MESLAILVALLFIVAFLAGPIAIGLSSRRLTNYLNGRKSGEVNSIIFLVLDLLRKILHIFLVLLGTIIGTQFLILQKLPLVPRLIGLFALSTSYIGLRREYFPDKFFIRQLFSSLGISKKNGRSSGQDGFGPDGQH